MSTNRIRGWFEQNLPEVELVHKRAHTSEGLETLRRRLECSRERYGHFLNATLMPPATREQPVQG